MKLIDTLISIVLVGVIVGVIYLGGQSATDNDKKILSDRIEYLSNTNPNTTGQEKVNIISNICSKYPSNNETFSAYSKQQCTVDLLRIALGESK